jgi:hypothetical protein
MIHAFVETMCSCGCGVVRAGPEATEYGKPFDFAVAYVIKEGRVIVKSLVAPLVPWWLRWLVPARPFTRAYYQAIYSAIEVATGLKLEWERIKN